MEEITIETTGTGMTTSAIGKTIEYDVKTNIIYFTTGCNLACTYCYEALDEKKGVVTSREDLKRIADETIEREPDDKQTFFELFGGEPTLVWENVEYFMDYAYSLKKDVYFEMITNGIKFKDDEFMFQVYNNKHVKEGRVSISISYDGLEGNVDRIYRGGKSSTMTVVEVLAKLTALDFKFRVRYTIHKKNILHMMDDIKKLNKHFTPERIITSEVNEQYDISDWELLRKNYTTLKYMWQQNEIQIPICDVFCESCDGCGIRRDNLQYFVGDKEFNKKAYSEIEFNHFEIKD